MEVFAEFNILADLSQEWALLLVEKKGGCAPWGVWTLMAVGTYVTPVGNRPIITLLSSP
jgi:hypothetical protein